MTTQEAAGILDCTPGHVQDLVREKVLPGKKRLLKAEGGGRRWKWDVDGKAVRARRRRLGRR